MATEVVLGTNAFIKTRTERISATGEGRRIVETWQGPQALITTKEDELWTRADIVSVNSTNGVPAQIKAEFVESTQSVIQIDLDTVWEHTPVALDKPLNTHPAFNTTSQAIMVQERIEEAIRKGVAADIDFDADFGVPNMNDFRNLRLKGVESYRLWSFVISKTIKSGREGLLKAEFENVQKVVKYVDIGLPTWVKWETPNVRLWNGTTAVTRPIAEWLVGPPTIRYEGKRYTLTQEWVGAEKWYAILYEGGTGLTAEEGNF